MNFLSKENIIFNKDLCTKNEVLEAISDKAVALGISNNKNELIESFMAREKLGSTGFGEGLAIPHAKCAYVQEVAIMIVKSDIPIEWESVDGTPVYVAIALLVPKDNLDNIHLKVLSGISRKLVNKEFKDSIFASNSADELLKIFEEVIVEN